MTTKTAKHDELIEQFLDVTNARYGGYSYAAGYLSAMLKGFGDINPQVASVIERELGNYLRGAK